MEDPFVSEYSSFSVALIFKETHQMKFNKNIFQLSKLIPLNNLSISVILMENYFQLYHFTLLSPE